MLVEMVFRSPDTQALRECWYRGDCQIRCSIETETRNRYIETVTVDLSVSCESAYVFLTRTVGVDIHETVAAIVYTYETFSVVVVEEHWKCLSDPSDRRSPGQHPLMLV